MIEIIIVKYYDWYYNHNKNCFKVSKYQNCYKTMRAQKRHTMLEWLEWGDFYWTAQNALKSNVFQSCHDQDYVSDFFFLFTIN